jgi:exopolysaccharide production protein ExoY
MRANSSSDVAIDSFAFLGQRPQTGTASGGWLHRFTALVLLLVLSPVFLIICALIWRKDGAPIFFGHFRVGYRGRVFRCLKFRTMYREAGQMLQALLESSPEARAEWARDQKLRNDPRITPIGHFLRKTSLDELPQLFNVLRGEMNLVGPRPIIVEELTRYGRSRWDYLAVKPGITGLWQVSGRNLVSYEQRVALDRRYVEQQSAWLDLTILVRTVKVLITREGAG